MSHTTTTTAGFIVEIVTNNHWRDVLAPADMLTLPADLLERERELEAEAEATGSFWRLDEWMFRQRYVMYHGDVIDLDEFMTTALMSAPFSDWDGACADTYFSGLLIRFDERFERIQIARWGEIG